MARQIPQYLYRQSHCTRCHGALGGGKSCCRCHQSALRACAACQNPVADGRRLCLACRTLLGGGFNGRVGGKLLTRRFKR